MNLTMWNKLSVNMSSTVDKWKGKAKVQVVVDDCIVELLKLLPKAYLSISFESFEIRLDDLLEEAPRRPEK